MALIIGLVMPIVMLLFMWPMYKNKKENSFILAGSAVVFALSLLLVRSQELIEDTGWMKALIPYHFIAILTSERADISDPRVRELADTIIKTQREKIAKMEKLIEELENEEELIQKRIAMKSNHFTFGLFLFSRMKDSK